MIFKSFGEYDGVVGAQLHQDEYDGTEEVRVTVGPLQTALPLEVAYILMEQVRNALFKANYLGAGTRPAATITTL